MKESSVVHAYRSPLSPPSLPLLCRVRSLPLVMWPRKAASAAAVATAMLALFCAPRSLVRCSVLTIQSRTAERARSPLHSALHSVFAAPRSGFVRNCMRRGGHASWASQSEASRRGLGGNWYERQLPTD